MNKTIEEKTDTRSKIIEAAAEILGRERNLNLTIRDIASRAEANIASINYYFRTKENLLEEVERLLMEKIKEIYDGLLDETVAARDRLITWADRLLAHLIDYPGIIYLVGTRVLERESAGLNEYLKLLETVLTPVVKELTGITEPQKLSFKVVQLISGVVYPLLIYSGTEKTAGIDIGDNRTRQAYLDSLVSGLATKPSP